MKILIVGGGGREHALAWKAAQSELIEAVYVAPGNAGSAAEPKARNVDIAAEDIDALKTFALREEIDLTIVGPEAPLVAGIVDDFEAAGLKVFGPNRAAARLEGSKAFAKEFLKKHKIPTAAGKAFTEQSKAIEHIKKHGAPIVVKADGLAAGKGVVVAKTVEQAIAAVGAILEGGKFGAAGRRIVLEDCVSGEEASFICIVDGETVLPMASCQDHKARDNGGKGPNTGGMGAYSPAPVVDAALHERVMREVIRPTVAGLAAELSGGYRGFLYAGLMIDKAGTPHVLEFNCRLGDPETQPMMLRLRSDFVALCLAALDGELAGQTLSWDPRAALGVVMAAGGYPEAYKSGDTIHGLAAAEIDNKSKTVKVFHAGTALAEPAEGATGAGAEGDAAAGAVVTRGGRVLCVTALAGDLEQAAAAAYAGARKISWEGAFYRTDIGHRAMNR